MLTRAALALALLASPAAADGLAVPLAIPQVAPGAAMTFPPQTSGGGGFSYAWEFGGNANNGFGQTALSFISVPLGTASSDRIIEVQAFAPDGGGTVNSVTICGSAGTAATGNLTSAGTFYLNVPTGATCTITVNGASMYDVSIAVWAMHGQSGGASATPTNSNTLVSSGGEPIPVAYTVAAGGFAAMTGWCQGATSNAFTWTVVTSVGTNQWNTGLGGTPVLASAQGTASGTATGSSGTGACQFGAGFFTYASFGP